MGAMFGFSLPKLLVIVAVIAVVWYAFKFIGRRNQVGATAKTPRRSTGKKSRDQIEDLVQCTVCGTYVQSGGATCVREDCPYRN